MPTNDEIKQRLKSVKENGDHMWCRPRSEGGSWDECVDKLMSEARADERARQDTLEDPELLEKLADLEHDRWSRWEKYRAKRLNDLGGVLGDGPEYHIQLYEWERKSNLDYSQLTEKEKESDRTEARKTLELIKKYLKVE